MSKIWDLMGKPKNWLRGGTKIGQSYTGWNTHNQGKPDFGKGAGPGIPYQEVTGKIKNPTGGKVPDWVLNVEKPPNPVERKPTKMKWPSQRDAALEAIQRRLGKL